MITLVGTETRQYFSILVSSSYSNQNQNNKFTLDQLVLQSLCIFIVLEKW